MLASQQARALARPKLRGKRARQRPRRREAPSSDRLSGQTSHRIEAIDLARGVAVCLMILSHGVKGLLSFEQFTWWGLVPIHAITKFSSSLFILVFGVALGVTAVPVTATERWPERRRKLWRTGLKVLLWYKLLTIVEMQHLHGPRQILDALVYRAFPSYVEVLGFYAIALLWLPLILPLWARTPPALRWMSPLLLAIAAQVLSRTFDFWGVAPLRAILVEHPDYYVWGQLSRGPLVLLGMCLGGLLSERRAAGRDRLVAAGLAVAGTVMFVVFSLLVGSSWQEALFAIARNRGKHPPGLLFMLFSLGGASLLLAVALFGGNRLARRLSSVARIGAHPLPAFGFHIVVLFLVLRTTLGFFHSVSYEFALLLAVGLIVSTAAWIQLVTAARSWVRPRREATA
jgi:hypothetical protein